MGQFDIVINKNNTKDVEYLIILQADEISELATRIVAPLRKAVNTKSQYISKIHIEIEINNQPYIAFISEMAAIPIHYLGDCIINLSHLRTEVTSAIDLLFTGF